MNPVVLALFPLPFIVLGSLLLIVGKQDILVGLSSKKWPIVRGTVQSVTTLRAGNYGDNGSPPGYHFYVRYHYELDGRRYWGDWKTPAARSVERATTKCSLQEGDAIDVHYCPDDPKLSVKEPGLTLTRLGQSIAGVAFIIGPSVLAWGILYAQW